MIGYIEAMDRLMRYAPRIRESVEVTIEECPGRVLSEDVFSLADVPGFDKAAMDGFAVRSVDTQNPPVELKIIEDIPAGVKPRKCVGKGTASRIMTGAMLPDGADSVVMWEDCEEKDGVVIVKKAVKKGQNVSRKGEDFSKDALLASKGTILDFRHTALFAACGISRVSVVRKPRVCIFTTGDEIVEPGEEAIPPATYNVNRSTLSVMVKTAGAEIFLCKHLPDNLDELKEHFRESADSGADILLFNAGISTGLHDVVRGLMSEEGVNEIYYKVAIKPGKPVYFGMYRNIPVFGLPGYPGSTIVTFLRFVKPFIYRMMGATWKPRGVWAKAATDIAVGGKRQSLIRVQLRQENRDFVFSEAGPHKSGVVSSIAASDGFILVDNPQEGVKAGERFFVYFWT